MHLKVEKLIYGGDGLARLPADEHGRGKTVFVPFVIPGETLEATLTEIRPGFARARLDSIVVPSPERTEPGCPYFGRCGGCHYQHIDYAAQLRYKADILRETLRRTAKVELTSEVSVHASAPWAYRNRTRMHVRHQPEFAMGYFRHGSHTLLPVETCPISSQLINKAIAAVWQLGRDGVVPRAVHGLQFFADADDGKLLLEIYVERGSDAAGADGLAAPLQRLLPEVQGAVVFAVPSLEDEARQHAPLTATYGEPLGALGGDSLSYKVGEEHYRVRGGSFFQVNRFLAGKLVELVVGDRTGRTALDLYAGAGLFTVPLARNFDQVIAIEASAQSFGDLRQNVPSNVKCVRSTTESYLAGRAAKLAPDLVVLDPPRAGLGEKAAKTLCRLSASRVTYVSCDPATLSRDLRPLLESGYRVEQAHLVDLFPQTYHMETVLHLAR